MWQAPRWPTKATIRASSTALRHIITTHTKTTAVALLRTENDAAVTSRHAHATSHQISAETKSRPREATSENAKTSANPHVDTYVNILSVCCGTPPSRPTVESRQGRGAVGGLGRARGYDRAKTKDRRDTVIRCVWLVVPRRAANAARPHRQDAPVRREPIRPPYASAANLRIVRRRNMLQTARRRAYR